MADGVVVQDVDTGPLAKALGAGASMVALTELLVGLLRLATAVELTLDTNGDIAKTASKNHFTVDTFEDAASDTLRKMTGGAAGDIVFLHPAHDDRSIIIEHDAATADEFRCDGATNITLTETTDWAVCVHDGTGWIVFAINTLAANVATGRIVDLAVSTAKLAAAAVTKAKALVFSSTEQTGTGSSQDVAHGLGVVPALVLVAPTELAADLAAGYDCAEGAHDATNVKVTVTTGAKFKVLAWG